MDKNVALVEQIAKDLGLRDYQDRIFVKAAGLLERGVGTILIESPTGSGKSRMGLALVRYVEESRGWGANWVAMRHRLLRQVVEENDAVAKARRLLPLSMFASTIPSAEMTVVDEAQHDAAATCVNVHSQSRSKFILGLTATPFRTDSLKLAFEYVIKDAGIHRLIRDGWLSEFHHWALRHHTPEHVAEAYLSSPERWGKSVAFFHTIAQCEEFARLLALGGHHCEVVIGGRPGYTEGQLDAFDRREFSVVANAMVLTEGYDDPGLETVFVRDSAKVPTIQMAGRALRTFAGKTHANIVQSVNTPWPFTRTATPHRSMVLQGSTWFTLGTTEAIERQSKAVISKLATVHVTLPSFFVDRSREKKDRWGSGEEQRHLALARPDVDANGNPQPQLMQSDRHGRITGGSVI